MSTPDVTGLLRAWSAGDAAALDALTPLVYDELRRQAARALAREAPGHTLRTTELVHEAWLRLAAQRPDAAGGRAHFYGIAARLIRQVLVDAARARGARKRGGDVRQVPLDVRDAPAALAVAVEGGHSPLDLLALDEALSRLAALDPLQGRVVELRYFAGLEIEEVAEALGVSPATVKREWAVARAFLRRELAT